MGLVGLETILYCEEGIVFFFFFFFFFMVETFFWRGLVDSEKRKRERERNENREKKQQLTSVATPALTRTEDRREPARGRAAAAAGAADERRRAAAAAAAGLSFFLVDREGQRKEILVWSRPTKRERERERPFSSKQWWWSCCLDRVHPPSFRSAFLARLAAFSSHRRGLTCSRYALCALRSGLSRRRALKEV